MDQKEFSSDVMLPIGYQISNRYEISRYLASGATGSVFVATDRLLEDTTVAIKVLRTSAAKNNEQIRRFLREVKLMNSVNHRNVVRTFDAGTDRDLIYYTMEFVEGISLEKYAIVHNIDFDLLESLLLQICLGLEAIHNANIIHRDLKPSNIILDNRLNVKIADFGVARPIVSSLTQNGSIMGSFHYMAPEVWEGENLTTAVDFYSLGVILYELAVGEVPFDAEIPAQIMRMHLHQPPTPIISVRPEAPPWLNNLILKLLQKNPKERPRSAREIINFVMTVTSIDHEEGIEEEAAPLVVQAQEPEPPLSDIFSAELSESIESTTSVDALNESIPLSPSLPLTNDACESIIFKAFPTQEEIIAHEERMLRSSQHRRVHADDGFNPDRQEEEIRKLQRIIRVVSALAVVVFAAVLILLVRQTNFFKRDNQSPRPWNAPERTWKEVFTDLLPGRWENPAKEWNTVQSATQAGARAVGTATEFGKSVFGGIGSKPVANPLLLDPKKVAAESGSEAGFEIKTFENTGTSYPSTRSNGSESSTEVVQAERQNDSDNGANRSFSNTESLKKVDDLVRFYSVSSLGERFSVLEDVLVGANKLTPETVSSLADLEIPPENWEISKEKERLRNEIVLLTLKLTLVENPTSDWQRIANDAQQNLDKAENAKRAADLQLSVEKVKYLKWKLLYSQFQQGDLVGTSDRLSSVDGVLSAKKAEYDVASASYNAELEKSSANSKETSANAQVRKLGEALQEKRDVLHAALEEKLTTGLARQILVVMQLAYVERELEVRHSMLSDQIRTLKEFRIQEHPKKLADSITEQRYQAKEKLKVLSERLSDEQEMNMKLARSLSDESSAGNSSLVPPEESEKTPEGSIRK